MRFELTGPFEPSVFKTDAIGLSATLPKLRDLVLRYRSIERGFPSAPENRPNSELVCEEGLEPPMVPY